MQMRIRQHLLDELDIPYRVGVMVHLRNMEHTIPSRFVYRLREWCCHRCCGNAN